jgi:uncharacterized membrane protein
MAWTNTTGAQNAGVVTFHRLRDNHTRIMLQLDYEPESLVENVGNMLGVVSARVRGDLGRFRAFIASRGVRINTVRTACCGRLSSWRALQHARNSAGVDYSRPTPA